jgi:hypothetical protein
MRPCARVLPSREKIDRAKDDRLLTDSVGFPPVASTDGNRVDRFESRSGKLRIATCCAQDVGRSEAEAFVRERYWQKHGASIHTFMPTLLVLLDATDALLGVTGCRVASQEGLYLERYLPKPIEAVLAGQTGTRAARSTIVEVGNFACRNPHAATKFISLLPRHLLQLGCVWAAFTATSSVRRILRHLGARCADLGAANGACARGGPDEWGGYYAADPRVLAGYLPLARRIPALWSRADAD